jgi:hypothetical protein
MALVDSASAQSPLPSWEMATAFGQKQSFQPVSKSVRFSTIKGGRLGFLQKPLRKQFATIDLYSVVRGVFKERSQWLYQT